MSALHACTVPGCTASHTVTRTDGLDAMGRTLSLSETIMTAHFREANAARFAKPFVMPAARPASTSRRRAARPS